MLTFLKKKIEKLTIATTFGAQLFWKLLNYTPPTKNARVWTLNRHPLGFSQKCIASGQTVAVLSRPQILFRPTELVIPDHIAERCVIVDIKVGKNSQLADAHSIHGAVFAASAARVENAKMRLDTVQPAGDMTLMVLNTGDTPLDFSAAMFGDTLIEDVNEVVDRDEELASDIRDAYFEEKSA